MSSSSHHNKKPSNHENVVPILHIQDGDNLAANIEQKRSVTISPAATPMEESGGDDYFGSSHTTGTNLRPGMGSRKLSGDNQLSVYRGSYIKSSTSLRSLGNHDALNASVSRPGSVRSSHRYSLSRTRMERILPKEDEIRDTYGLEELRDGFFDAIFVPPTSIETTFRQALNDRRLPEQQPVDKDRLSVRLRQTSRDIIRKIIHTKTGRQLLRAMVGYFVCYVLCLTKPTKNMFGRYGYFAPWAAIIHHSGRTFGSQLEISLESFAGVALGMGWSSLALYISTATQASSKGYGGIHATSLILALLLTSWVRAHFIRMYHGLMSCALALIFMETVKISDQVYWRKAFEFGIPYLFGLAVALLASAVVFPDFGHEALMDSLHGTLIQCQKMVQYCGSRDREQRRIARKELTDQSLEFVYAFREMSMEFTLTTVTNPQMFRIRNALQTAVTRYRAIPKPATLFTRIIAEPSSTSEQLRIVFGAPCRDLILTMATCLEHCAAYTSEYLKRGDKKFEIKLDDHLGKLDEKIASMSQAYHKTVSEGVMTSSECSSDQEVLDIMLYIHYVFEASKSTRSLLTEFIDLHHNHKRRWIVSRPSYPFRRALYRTTAQITHDRGGRSAAYYYQAKRDVEDSFRATDRINTELLADSGNQQQQQPSQEFKVIEDAKGWRYKCWYAMHKMQGFETRFALKASVTLTLVSIPGWVDQSQEWYSNYDSWFAVVIALIALHPRVGGNVGDFITRSAFIFAGAFWAAVGNYTGSEYGLGVLSLVFMIPCMYRFIISSHPRSGLLGCISFTLVSLSVETGDNIIKTVWTRYVALQVGLSCAVLISWIFWPFVARHEVRKSSAIAISQISRCYQIVTDRYLYKYEHDELSPTILQLGELREARILHSLRAVEELIEMSYHEPTLRGVFDPAPYTALLHSCQYIFQKTVDARISSIYFDVFESDANPEITRQLLSLRRDTAASVIYVFYLLANSLRNKQPLTHMLPSTVMTRKLLFDSVARLTSHSRIKDTQEHHVWQVVHEAAFSRAFTDITEELEKMIAIVKYILGEDHI